MVFFKRTIFLVMVLSMVMLFCGLPVAKEENIISTTGEITGIDREMGLVIVDGVSYLAEFELDGLSLGDKVKIAYFREGNNENLLVDIAKIEMEAP